MAQFAGAGQAGLVGDEQGAAQDASPFFISVIVVNYNGAGWIDNCLASLVTQTHRGFEIIVVDNGSTDDSCALVEKGFPTINLIRSPSNVGFAAGNNLGLAAAQGGLIATLNTDTRAENDYLEKLVVPMQDAKVGACAPLMLEMEHPEIVDAAGIRIDDFGFAWNIGAGEPAAQFSTSAQVYGACAGAALYRRAMLDALGFFDGDYFGFYEDADLAWRAHNAGWKTVVVPAARVYHQHGASFGKISPRKTYLLARNRWWTIFKNYPQPQFAFMFPMLAAADLVSLFGSAPADILPRPGRAEWMHGEIAKRGSLVAGRISRIADSKSLIVLRPLSSVIGHSSFVIRRSSSVDLPSPVSILPLPSCEETVMQIPFSAGATLTQGFGENPQNYKQFGLNGHEGLDFIPKDADKQVYAVESGMVVSDVDDPVKGKSYGTNVVIFVPANRRIWTYAHLATNFVNHGDKVLRGQPVGIMGDMGNTTGPHLHLGLRLARRQRQPAQQ